MLKRKLPCCEWNEKKRQKHWKWNCDICECTFPKKREHDNHVNGQHKCKKCSKIVSTEEERLQHEDEHRREEEASQELKRQHEAMNDSFVLNFLIPKKLNEYTPDPDNELDFEYIFRKHYEHIGSDDIVYFVTELNLCIEEFWDNEIGVDDVIYLLEKGAISEPDATAFLDNNCNLCFVDYYKELIEYFLDNGFTIKPLWVARFIEDDELIQRIKSKFEFEFDEIYDARYECSDFFDNNDRDHFYVNVHKHFPDPEFDDPFKDPFDDYKQVSTDRVEDVLHRRYYYNEEDDELNIVIDSYRGNYSISLGKSKRMMKRPLQDLISKYQSAVDSYETSNEQVSQLFDEKEEIVNEVEAENPNYEYMEREFRNDALESNSEWCNVMDEIHKVALPERNYWANRVALLYFVISNKIIE